jgi:hypothetical protein
MDLPRILSKPDKRRFSVDSLLLLRLIPGYDIRVRPLGLVFIMGLLMIFLGGCADVIPAADDAAPTPLVVVSYDQI